MPIEFSEGYAYQTSEQELGIKMEIEMRYRAHAEESIENRYMRIIKELRKIGSPWGLSREALLSPPPDIDSDLGVDVNLTPMLGSGIACQLHFVYRNSSYLRDRGQYDDSMFIDCELNDVDCRHVAREVFPMYVRAFTPYRGTMILDEDLAQDDWEKIVDLREETGKDIDGRDSIFRIHPVNYFDRELCQRAFGLSPEDVEERLRGKVEEVSLLLDGILLIVATEATPRSEFEQVSIEVLDCLSAK